LRDGARRLVLPARRYTERAARACGRSDRSVHLDGISLPNWELWPAVELRDLRCARLLRADDDRTVHFARQTAGGRTAVSGVWITGTAGGRHNAHDARYASHPLVAVHTSGSLSGSAPRADRHSRFFPLAQGRELDAQRCLTSVRLGLAPFR